MQIKVKSTMNRTLDTSKKGAGSKSSFASDAAKAYATQSAASNNEY